MLQIKFLFGYKIQVVLFTLIAPILFFSPEDPSNQFSIIFNEFNIWFFFNIESNNNIL